MNSFNGHFYCFVNRKTKHSYYMYCVIYTVYNSILHIVLLKVLLLVVLAIIFISSFGRPYCYWQYNSLNIFLLPIILPSIVSRLVSSTQLTSTSISTSTQLSSTSTNASTIKYQKFVLEYYWSTSTSTNDYNSADNYNIVKV